jgi:hypothetical protein
MPQVWLRGQVLEGLVGPVSRGAGRRRSDSGTSGPSSKRITRRETAEPFRFEGLNEINLKLEV